MTMKQQALETAACIADGSLGKALQVVKGMTALARPAEAAAAIPGLAPTVPTPPWSAANNASADDEAAFN